MDYLIAAARRRLMSTVNDDSKKQRFDQPPGVTPRILSKELTINRRARPEGEPPVDAGAELPTDPSHPKIVPPEESLRRPLGNRAEAATQLQASIQPGMVSTAPGALPALQKPRTPPSEPPAPASSPPLATISLRPQLDRSPAISPTQLAKTQIAPALAPSGLARQLTEQVESHTPAQANQFHTTVPIESGRLPSLDETIDQISLDRTIDGRSIDAPITDPVATVEQQFVAPVDPTSSQPSAFMALAPSLPRRLLAWTVDLTLLATIVLGLLMAAALLVLPANTPMSDRLKSISIPGVLLAAIIGFIYTALFGVLWEGRSPGRLLAGLCLVDRHGQRIGFAAAFMRAFLSLFSFGFFLMGFWLAIFDPSGQTLHDKLTRTFVVRLQDD